MKHRLLIVGAGGFGRETLQWAEDAAAAGADWVLGGYLDDNPRALDGYDSTPPVLMSPGEYVPSAEDRLICAIADPPTRLTIAADLTRRGAKFTTLVHPTAIIGRRTTLGEGCIVCPRVTITTDVTIGRHVVFNPHSTIGHDARIADCCTVFSHCDVTGNVVLDVGVTVGSHSSIVPNVKIGQFAKVSAGSVVTRRVKPHTTVYGVPAKKLMTLTPAPVRDAA